MISFTPQARKRISDEAIERLHTRPTDVERDRLPMRCNITIIQVHTWFNNARSRRDDTHIQN
jgi:hypothetical protein